jgi:hypothetical protein
MAYVRILINDYSSSQDVIAGKFVFAVEGEPEHG